MAVSHKQLVIERAPTRRVQLFDASRDQGATPHYRLRLGESELPSIAAKLAAESSIITGLYLADGDDRPLDPDMYGEEIEELQQALNQSGESQFRELLEEFSSNWKLVSFEVRDPDWSVYQVRRGGSVEVISDRGESRLVGAVQRFLRAE